MIATADDPTLAALDQDILAAHAANDRPRLVHLYAAAASQFEQRGEIDRAAFLHVQAYVLALDAGELGMAARSHAFLVLHGREPAA